MKPTLKELEDNYDRVLLQLGNGHLAGIKKANSFTVVEQQNWFNHGMPAIELADGYKRASVFGYNIDKIKFLAKKNDVDTFLHYDDCEIDWDWDINNPHNLKFKKGDVVVIDHAENRSAYVRMLGKVGTIVDAEYTRYVDDERLTYRVRVDDSPNEYQEQGLWVFHKEKSLKLYNPHNLKVKIGDNEYAIQHLDLAKVPYNRDYTIKGETNNMMNEILEIYEEKQLRKINKKYDDLEQLIKLTDERYKVWLECTTTLDKLYAEDKIVSFAHANIELSEDTKKKLRTIVYDKREEELRKFYSKKAEVNAQLSMCETYDQKQEILRRYNIINKNGKVNG